MDKKILLSFFSELEATGIKAILKLMTNYQVEISKNYEDALQNYKEFDYEFVIIDHKTKSGNHFIEDILNLNKNQSIVLISDTLNCPITCDECLRDYNFLRLVKPVNYKNLIALLNKKESFVCINKYKFSQISTIKQLDELLYLKEFLVFNHKTIENDKLIVTSNEKLFNQNFMLREYTLLEESINSDLFNIILVDKNRVEIETK